MGSGVDLELSGSGVVEALAWPSGSREGMERRPRGWRLGTDASGRVRARIEAPIGALLVFRTSGGVIRVPLPAVLEGPQRLQVPGQPEIAVERLPWDALTVDLPRGDGTVVPGSQVSASVGFNILTACFAEVTLHSSAELRPMEGESRSVTRSNRR